MSDFSDDIKISFCVFLFVFQWWATEASLSCCSHGAQSGITNSRWTNSWCGPSTQAEV